MRKVEIMSNSISPISISGYSLKDLKPEIQDYYLKKMSSFINKLPQDDKLFIEGLSNRLLKWKTVSETELVGKSPEEIRFIRRKQTGNPENNEEKEIIVDLTRKALAIIAEADAIIGGKAIAYIWHTRRDNKVVGKPDGENPYPTKEHGNHWDREGKMFLLRSWATEKGYLKDNKDVIFSDKLTDGSPGMAKGCRCYAEYLFAIELFPTVYKNCITIKGLDYIK